MPRLGSLRDGKGSSRCSHPTLCFTYVLLRAHALPSPPMGPEPRSWTAHPVPQSSEKVSRLFSYSCTSDADLYGSFAELVSCCKAQGCLVLVDLAFGSSAQVTDSAWASGVSSSAGRGLRGEASNTVPTLPQTLCDVSSSSFSCVQSDFDSYDGASAVGASGSAPIP